jgi:putative peptide zinc metalloprotease protein
VICRNCRCQVGRSDAFCPTCGTSVLGGSGGFDVVLPDGARVPLRGVVTIGRADGNDLRVDERSVSRHHARVLAAAGVPPVLEDIGSTHGTLVDGREVSGRAELTDGSRIGLGDVELRVERHREAADAGRTLVVPVGGSVVLPALGVASADAPGATGGFHPRLRSGYRLKRLAADEGALRWVLRSDRTGDVMRLGDEEAGLVGMLDGEHALPDLLVAAEERLGPAGVGRLARLLSSLGERGMLAGVERREPGAAGRVARLATPRQLWVRDTGPFFASLYRRAGWVLFTKPGLAIAAAIALGGLVAFIALIVGRGGTPFVVASKIGIGGLVFLAGRFLVVALHETAHALTMASFGRPVPRAGLMTVIGIPFAFVDTSDGWFEPRRRRLAISAAGPASDLVVGGAAALLASAAGAGNLRDVLYQVALAAYVGALFNLNPFLERDGYHILVDVLREPGLRRRAREHFARRLSGRPVDATEGRAVTIYGIASVGWMIVAAGFVIILTLVYASTLEEFASPQVVWAVLGAFYLLLFVPVGMVLGRPLMERWRRAPKEVAGAAG